jgi:hypothetical protein
MAIIANKMHRDTPLGKCPHLSNQLEPLAGTRSLSSSYKWAFITCPPFHCYISSRRNKTKKTVVLLKNKTKPVREQGYNKTYRNMNMRKEKKNKQQSYKGRHLPDTLMPWTIRLDRSEDVHDKELGDMNNKWRNK